VEPDSNNLYFFLFTFSENQVNIMHDKYALNNFTVSKISLSLKAGSVYEYLQHPVRVAFLRVLFYCE
jgi:hypothetical protein